MTTSRVEAELKYLAADDRPLRLLEGMDRLGPARLGRPTTTAELDRYLDTEDLRLATARWACRLRTRDGRSIVSLKGPAEHAADDPVHRRPELEGPAGAGLDPLEWPPSAARAFVVSLAGGMVLMERLRLQQERTERGVELGVRSVATLSLDRVRVVSGGVERGRMRIVELELRSLAGADETALQLAAALAEVPGLTLDPLSKLERALAMLPGT